MQEENQGLKLVSSQFRKRRVARWAACSGPVPSFRARVFRHCDTCARAGGKPGFEASFYGRLTAAVQEDSESLKLKAPFGTGLPVPGPFRPSKPKSLGTRTAARKARV